MIQTRVFKIPDPASNPVAIEEAARVLRDGGLVAFPTETVYGLGADAFNEEAVQRVFEVKGRPVDNPLIVHIADNAQLQEVAGHLPPQAVVLARRFWPGPLTLVLTRGAGIPDQVTAHLETVAVRMPAHPVALAVIGALGRGIVGPSANLSGKPSPTRAEHVLFDFENAIDVVLDAGPTQLGVESTILDVTVDPPLILRLGGLTRGQIESAIGRVETTADAGILKRAPGTRHRHYAPNARVLLIRKGDRDMLGATLESTGKNGQTVGCILHSIDTNGLEMQGHPTARAKDMEDFSRNLYGMLREMDQRKVDVIIVESVPPEGIGAAVMDRLRRAAAGMNMVDADLPSDEE